MKHRKLFTAFILFDLALAAGIAVWWLQRHRPDGPIQTPTATETATPTPAVTPPAETPVTVPAESSPAAETALPRAPAGLVERHGTYRGEPFWLRLHPPSEEFAGKRQLELVYTPTPSAEVDGSLIHDSPILVVDDHLRLVRWDNRDGATGILRENEPPSYLVHREKRAEDKVQILKRVIDRPQGWPLEIAGILAVLAEGDSWSIPVIDFWGPRVQERLNAERAGETLTIGGTSGGITAAGVTVAGLETALSTP